MASVSVLGVAIGALASISLVGQTPATKATPTTATRPWTVSKTPDGQPDLQGVVQASPYAPTIVVAAEFTRSSSLKYKRPSAGSSLPLRLLDLESRVVDPFQAPPNAKAIVFLFISVECPISNRYAPEVRRLQHAFSPRGIAFSLVYANPAESPQAIRSHLDGFGYSARVLRDPRHELVKLTKATVTPEAAVYDNRRRFLYRGRIDDRYVSIGVERPAATRHDLEEALIAVLAGKPVSQPTTQAVGCFLVDFAR
jgi:hypothetical protein